MSRRTIMIVGNGSVPEGAAAKIDAADTVIRFNDCRSVGPSGSKTDIVAVCNTGRPARSMLEGGWKTNAAVCRAKEIWSVRSAEKFSKMRAGLIEAYPDLGDFCDDYTRDFAAYAEMTGRLHRVLPAHVHEQLDRDLARFSPAPYVVPSSGMVVIAAVLSGFAKREDDVMLTGFDHVGWELHPFTAERRLVETLISQGHLRRLA
ncbi:Urease operon accessory protein [Phyllobacterium leguminum]|uniref:Urease operon accessory protein n=1 Tax=Phyllobacterium leguminum TaxID=314237 RepID=A0A318T203_9HYPH|nr:Urease operon accessory protein [Phyllobacterium leguminum]PYE87856.1 hypothetical protein C7477_11041 [Phyllobacterium leguminum]